MKLPTTHAIGFTAIIALIIFAVFSITERDCVCTAGEGCFCPESGADLQSVTKEDLKQIPEPEHTQYLNFLSAWEREYEYQNQEWVRQLLEFSEQEHSPDERRAFHRLLEKQRRDFYLLFRYRDSLFRESIGLTY